MPTTMRKELVSTVSASQTPSGEPSMIVSTGDLDRDGDRILPNGIQLENFQKNPTLFWAHNHRDLPIGTITRINKTSRGLQATWRWLENDEFASRVKNAWEQGVVRAASIGFIPLEATPNSFGGADITKSELLEASLVGLPANPTAVRALKSYGLYQPTLSAWKDDEPIIEIEVPDEEPVLLLQVPDEDPAEVLKSQIRGAVYDHLTQHPHILKEAVSPANLRPVLKEHVRQAINKAKGRLD